MNDNPTPKVYKTQKEIDAVRLGGDVDFRGATFKCHVDFSGKTFKGKVDFSGAVFEDGASFKDATFLTQGQDVLFENAVFQSPKNDVTFENSQFGLPYQREFGEWQIGFKRNEDGFSFLRRMKAEKPSGKFEDLGNGPIEDIQSFLETHGMEHNLNGINAAIGRYREAPKKVSFKGCRFENAGDVNFSSSSFTNGGEVSFRSSSFTNGGKVSFRSSSFTNGGKVSFRSLSFTNGGEVSFRSSSFANSGYVSFYNSNFTNGRWVDFRYASFTNGGDVEFSSLNFTNNGWVDFTYANFTNGGDVDFSSASFSNGGYVDFRSASFTNEGPLYFLQMIWANSGKLSFGGIKFKETAAVKFDECLLLPKRTISFKEIRFPEKGSLMFQRCYFARSPKIDFTGAVFRHTTFEGGKISWLEDQQDKTLTAIVKERLKEKFDHLPKEAKDRIDKLNIEIPEFSNVFEEEVEVFWKDLTTESAKNLTFRLTNLSHSLFDGMTPTHIQLNAPKWAQKKDGRNFLYEDLKSKGEERSPEQLRNIEDQYTQLKNNLERQGNYLHAGDFHYGEQEIRRERLIKEKGFYTDIPNIFKYLLATVYNWLSGYGERPLRAVGVFICWFMVLWVLVFLSPESGDVYSGFKEVSTLFSWAKPAAEGASSEWKSYYGFLIPGQLILFGIQLPLLVLAIRRRFKR